MSVQIPYSVLSSEMQRSSVRRCLFEMPTAEQREKDFEKMESFFNQDAKNFREKWGLDPTTGSIVNDAEYECVPVDISKESIPSFYTKCYAPRKMRPVPTYRRERSQFSHIRTRLDFDSPKPLKRKLQLDNNTNDENKESLFDEKTRGIKRVPSEGDIVLTQQFLPSRIISSSSSSVVSSPLSTSSSSSSSDESNSPISLPQMSSCLIHSSHLNNLIKPSSNPDVSPRSADLSTPQQRPRSLTQKTMKDYLPCKKQRCATKLLPRN